MKCCFVPALITGMENPVKQIVQHPETNRFGYYADKYDPSWFTDRAMFFHPEMLVSYYYSGKIPDYRKRLTIRDDVRLWADSGGYSIFTQGGTINPKDVLSWQEKNANIAFSLDIPPAASFNTTRCSPGKVVYYGLDKFEKNAIQSHQNNVDFQTLRTSDQLKIYNVIHGYNRETLNLWYDYVTDGIQFEGYATGTKPTHNILLQAMCVMYLWSRGIRERVHLLGVAGINVIPVLVWMSQYVDKISFDSTSYGYGSRTRAYMLPNNIKYYTHFGRKYLVKKNRLTTLNCPCPICQHVKTVDFFCESNITWPGMLISLHNLWLVQKYVQDLNDALHTEKNITKFNALVKQHTGRAADDCFHAIHFVEDVVKMGYNKAYDLYFADHDINKQKFEQKRLF